MKVCKNERSVVKCVMMKYRVFRVESLGEKGGNIFE